ncbi:hypothetical protein CesoFtcFv8_006442 [Champsocephalus esox]|uniref:Uncharacterized protein n=1 Tax=Champsocephalus esox TaxID=159716 RepID=A0AAN8CJU5_9TELE|nr:hypothetical protein CesoFtcFv8_006442 [Champsocephalus esox]
MSEPDLVSVESPEPPEGEDLREDEDEEEETVELLTHSGDGSRGESEHQQSDSFNGSAGDSSDTDGERTIQFSAERPPKKPSSPNEASGDRVPSPTTLHATDTQDASCSLDHQDVPTQLSAPVDVPNFFLPSHQLEASMRIIRLAPSFSNKTTDPGPHIPNHRGPRQHPNMSPSSMKKETERIAKIFSAHFDGNH